MRYLSKYLSDICLYLTRCEVAFVRYVLFIAPLMYAFSLYYLWLCYLSINNIFNCCNKGSTYIDPILCCCTAEIDVPPLYMVSEVRWVVLEYYSPQYLLILRLLTSDPRMET